MLKYYFLLAISVLSLTTKAQQIEGQTLLWKIEKEGLPGPSYLYGTMHVKDSRVFEFSDVFLPSFFSCDAFAMEVDPDDMEEYYFRQAFYGRYGGQNNDYILDWEAFFQLFQGINDYEQFLKASDREEKITANQDIAEINYEIRRHQMNQAPYMEGQKDKRLDFYLYTIAYESGMKTFGVEEVNDERMNLSDDAKYKTDVEIRTAMEWVQNKDRYEQLFKAYNHGDLNTLRDLYLDSNFVSRAFYQDILINRNYTMAESIDSLVQEHTTFVAVGAAHLPGDEGVIDLLNKMGYTVSPVYAPKTGAHYSFEIPKKDLEWDRVIDTLAGFSYNLYEEPYQLDILGFQNPIKMHIDSRNEYFYYAYGDPVSVEFDNFDDKSILKNEIEKFSNLLSGSVSSLHWEEYRGYTCAVFSIASYSGKAKGRAYVREGMIYFMLIGGDGSDDFDEYAEKYLESFRLEPMRKTDWELFSDERGAYSIELPVQPYERELIYPYNEDDISMVMHVAKDHKTDIEYVVRYHDFYPGQVVIDDESFIDNNYENIAAGLRTKRKKSVDFEGYNGIEASLEGDLYDVRLMIVLRGNRAYLIMANMPKGTEESETDDFFDSFRFDDYKVEFPFVYKSSHYPIEISFPNEFVPEETTYQDSLYSYSGDKNTKRVFEIYSTDYNTGLAYYFYTQEYSQFAVYQDSNFYQIQLEDFLNVGDTLTSIDTIMYQGVEGRDFLISRKDSEIKAKVRTLPIGNKIYQLLAYGTDKDFELGLDSMFFSTLVINDSVKTNTLFDQKEELIINGLKLEDPSEQIWAKRAVEELVPDSNNVQALVDLLKLSYYDDEEEEGTKEVILDLIKENKDLVSLDQFFTVYDHLKVDRVKIRYIETLASFKEERAARKVVKHLATNPPKEDLGYAFFQVFDNMEDSMVLYQNMLPVMMDLVLDTTYGHQVRWMFAESINKELVKKNYYNAYADHFYQSFYHLYDEYQLRKRNGDLLYNYKFVPLFKLLRNLPKNDKVLSYLKEMVNNTDFKYEAPVITTVLYYWTNSIDEEWLKSRLDPLETRSIYMDEFLKADLTKLIPEEYLNPIEMAKADVYAQAIRSHEAIKKIKYLESSVLIKDGRSEKVYVFKVKVKSWSGKYVWRYAMGGPYTDTDAIGYFTEVGDSLYLYPTVDDYINSYIQNYE